MKLFKYQNLFVGIAIGMLITAGAFDLWFKHINTNLPVTTSATETLLPAADSQRNVLKIVTLEWSPFVFTDENDVITGILPEQLRAAANKLDIEYTIESVPWNRALKMVEIGQADAILAAAYHESREPFLFYTADQRAFGQGGTKLPSNIFTSSDYVFFIRNTLAESMAFRSIEELEQKDYRIGLNTGYAYIKEVRDAKWNKVEHVSPHESFLALQAGTIDMYLIDKAVGLAELSNMQLLDDITFLPTSVFTEVLYMPFSKHGSYPNPQLTMYALYKEVQNLHESGRYDAIYQQFVPQDYALAK